MKKFIIALMAFALVITLAGCGGGGGGGGFHLDYGDNGAGLEKNFPLVKKAYEDINTVFQSNDSTSDKNGTIRANAFKEAISEKYKGTNKTHSDGSVTKVSTKSELVARLQSLIKNKKFEGLQIIPYHTNDGATATTVCEKTKLYVASFTHNKNNYTNKEYVFDSIKWQKEEDGVWRIVSGFDDLAKTASELAGI